MVYEAIVSKFCHTQNGNNVSQVRYCSLYSKTIQYFPLFTELQ